MHFVSGRKSSTNAHALRSAVNITRPHLFRAHFSLRVFSQSCWQCLKVKRGLALAQAVSRSGPLPHTQSLNHTEWCLPCDNHKNKLKTQIYVFLAVFFSDE